MATTRLRVTLPRPHEKQQEIEASRAKRKVIVAGRRAGKTTLAAMTACEKAREGRRVLLASPTQDQADQFWEKCRSWLAPLIDAGIVQKNETRRTLIFPNGGRIRAKTAHDADTLRGDYADFLVLDEFAIMDPSAWDLVGAPMLLDNDGDAIFIYTPPSLRTTSRTKARNPRHAAELYRKHSNDADGRWACFHFTSLENPHISADALDEIRADMTALAYKQEIMAEDVDEAPGALWRWDVIERLRVDKAPDLKRIAVGVDPSITSMGDECGIVVVGFGTDEHYYVLDDVSLQGAPIVWAQTAIRAYERHEANKIIYETNQGGEMVRQTLQTAGEAHMQGVHASRGKYTRAEPISLLTEQGKVHHVGRFDKLEAELCLWEPGATESPNRLDAFVWAATWLKEQSVRKEARLYH